MNVETLPLEIATLGRTDINEWTAVWSDIGIKPSSKRSAEIDRELQAMLCQHQAGARFSFIGPAPYQNSADPVIIGQDYSVVSEHEADPKEIECDVQTWAHGQCALLALRCPAGLS